MKKFLILFWLSLSYGVLAQTTQLELSGIPFEPEISAPDSVVALAVKNQAGAVVLKRKLSEKEKITIDGSGVYEIFSNGKFFKRIRVIPAWFSLLPPLLAILLALIFRQVLVALLAGIYLGAFFIYDYNFIAAFFRIADTIIVDMLTDKDHILIILFTVMIGGVVGVISANGGTVGMAEVIVKKARTARSGMIASWLMGVAIFFDDYSNSLLVGNMMRPITDKLKISREKLAYIVDSTAAPVTSLVVISTWIGYELGLIGDGLNTIGSHLSAYDVFIRSIPYRFYPIVALFFVLMIAVFRRDFGPMLKAEKSAKENGVSPVHTNIDDEMATLENKTAKPRWYNAIIPIAVLLVGTIWGLIITGKNSLEAAGITNYGLRQIISSSNSYYALVWGSFAASFVAVIQTVGLKILSLEKTLEAYVKGLRSMLFAVVILVLAWAISQITKEIHTADYIIDLLVGNVDIKLLATLVFLVCAVISFATGTSWGTMAIVMPIVVPLTWEMGISAGLPVLVINSYLISTIAAVLAGAVFGDHCSPIADTTILSSLASGCNHIAHVRTQLPYALLVGAVSVVFGSLFTAFGFPLLLAYVLIFATLFAVLFFFGKKV